MTRTERPVAPKVAVLMTCHNRRAQTLAALASLHGQTGLPPGTSLTVHLVDAGSTDGTGAAVRAAFPATDVVGAGPDVYWGTGTAMAAARADPGAHVLWLNDDVVLSANALAVLLHTAAPLRRASVVVGAMLSADGGRTTYGGYRLRPGRWRPPRLERVEPDPRRALACDSCNGNAVLVTRAARRALGDLDPAFPHRMGDSDYGLRARRAGIPVLLAPGHVGVCDDHPPFAPGTSRAPGITVRTALRRATSVREQPLGPWWRFCRRHFGVWSPLLFCSPYARTFVTAMWGRRSPAGGVPAPPPPSPVTTDHLPL
ncbi:glycosyltransferase family 2 protein [Streptomyces sp. NPDC101116]|uniref:glycosyltransferase family 2 protein n=1 Tax=Streptomyces sp. NPDC101116 TaxID=3366107 RepID=UPI003818476F